MSFALRLARAARPVSVASFKSIARPAVVSQAPARLMSTEDDYDPDAEGLNLAWKATEYTEREDGVRIPFLLDTLEWTLTSPPPFHQFEEPPIIVELDHLN